MSIEPLETPLASAYYDDEVQIAYITYRGELDDKAAIDVYNWLSSLANAIGFEAIKGEIFDFSQVTGFLDSNLAAARKISKRRNLAHNTQDHPVALVVSDPYQEELLRDTMRISPEIARKRIVWSIDEGTRFVQAWHAQKQPE